MGSDESFKGNIQYFGAQIFPVVWPVVDTVSLVLGGWTQCLALRIRLTRPRSRVLQARAR